jgi:hypothetical protein
MMFTLEGAFGLLSHLASHAAIGAVPAFVGTHIGDKWRDPTEPRWSLWLGIIFLGFCIFHFHELAQAIGANGEAS